MKKGYLDISFSWIFAIIVGAIILTGAIYGLSKFWSISEIQGSTEDAKALINNFNPLESNLQSAASSSIKMPVQSQILFSCDEYAGFGSQGVRIKEKLRNKWSESSVEVSFKNNYVFTESIVEGKDLYLFSKTFEMPFKVATLIYLIPKDKKYCFIDIPWEMEKELKNLNQENLIMEDDCTGDEIKVCFDNSQNCDIYVNSQKVTKGDSELHYEGEALMYAAIFSDEEIYSCNLNRLVYRIESLSEIYLEKASLLSQKGCSTNMESGLSTLKNAASSFDSQSEISQIASEAFSLESKNKFINCKLW